MISKFFKLISIYFLTLCFQTICITNSLAQVDFDEKNISWSERNKSIIFTSNAHGRADIYKMKGDGSNQEIILNSNENFKRLDW